MNRAEAAAVVRGIGEFLAHHADEVAASIVADRRHPGPAASPAPEVYLPLMRERVTVTWFATTDPLAYSLRGEVIAAGMDGARWTVNVLDDSDKGTALEFAYDAAARRWAAPDGTWVGIAVTRLEQPPAQV